MKQKIYILLILASLLLVPSTILAQQPSPQAESINVGYTIGDGKDGRTFAKWSYLTKGHPITSVQVSVRKKSGGNDTYVNLRFGKDSALENGKREFLKDSTTKLLTWDLGGQRSRGRPLILNAYNGEVEVISANVTYVVMNLLQQTKPHQSMAGGTPPASMNNPTSSETGDMDSCRHSGIRRPQIELGEFRASGGMFSGKYKLDGSVFASCVEEAGYYESGKRNQTIKFPRTDRAQRVEFSVKVHSGRNGEIRVYQSNGHVESIRIDDEILQQEKRNRGGSLGKLPF